MDKKLLLNHVAVKKKKARLSIKNLGEFYIFHEHTFPTKRLSGKKYDQVTSILKRKRFFYKTLKRNIVQVKTEISNADQLPTELLRGHYLEQLRWQTANPNTEIEIPESLEQILLLQQQIESIYEEIIEDNKKKLVGRAKSYVGRIRNQRIRNLEECLKSKTIPEEELEKELAKIFFSLPENPDYSYSFDQGLEVLVKNPYKINFLNVLPEKELKKQKWLLIDLEKPLYDEPEEEISWATMYYIYLEDGQPFKKEVHTLRKTSLQEYKKCKIIHHGSEEELLLNGIIGSIISEDPEVICAYNAPYDLKAIQEAMRENKIPKDKFFPKIEVAKQFFERMRINHRQVFDLLKYVQLAYKFLPDHKIETAAKYLLGEDKFSKIIDYDQMRALERDAKDNNNLQAADKICIYAINDVEVMVDLINSLSFPQAISPLCNHFKIELGTAVHNHSAVNVLREKKYFQEVGTFFEKLEHSIPKIRKKKKKLQEQADIFKESFLAEKIGYFPRIGFHKDVSLIYIPWADYLWEVLLARFDLKPFLKEKYKHFDNNEIQYYLSQHLNKFIEPMFREYVSWQNSSRELKKTLPGFTFEQIKEMVGMVHKNMKENSQWAPYHFEKGTLKEETFVKYTTVPIRTMLEIKNVNPEQLFKAHFSCLEIENKERFFYGRHGVEIGKVTAVLEEKISNLAKFIEENGLDVINTDGQHLFVKSKSLPEKREYYFRIVDSLDVLINEDFKPIYRLVGKYKNLKLKKKALNYQSVFETKLLSDFLGLVFSEKYSEAFRLAEDREETILERRVDNEDILYWTRGRDMYTGYDTNEEYKINFYLNREHTGESLYDEERGKYFDLIKPEVEEEGVALEKEVQELSERDDLSKKEKGRLRQLKKSIPKKRFTNRAYYLEIENFEPDFDFYHEKIFGKDSRIAKMVNAL